MPDKLTVGEATALSLMRLAMMKKPFTLSFAFMGSCIGCGHEAACTLKPLHGCALFAGPQSATWTPGAGLKAGA